MNPESSWDSKAITNVFLPVLRKLDRMDESAPFKSIIEADYNDVSDISVLPMDLSVIERRLTSNLYEEPWKFIKDVWLLFENAWLFNKESSKVYQYCSKVAEVFEREMNQLMKSLGYCCGRWYQFSPPTLKCSGKESCSIPKNTKYYTYNKELNFCYTCFPLWNDFHLLPNQKQKIGKECFIETKNDSVEFEPFAECNKCRRKVHEICVLYLKCLEKKQFVCNKCDPYAKSYREELIVKYSAKLLPITKLSQYIQERVDNFLKRCHVEVGNVTVRVIASSRKYTCVKNAMKIRFANTGKFPDKFPYTAKTMFVFYEIDKVDVAIFALHAQEYDDACPEPNSRRVYISYLDSVNFFRPAKLRTELYFEVLLGYMDYMKKSGYQAMHVWACPSPDGDDYLFHRHPPNQKSPDHYRLEEWYNKLLRKGTEDGIILGNLSLFCNNTPSIITGIPYFEKDFWPNMLEDTVKELQIGEDLNELGVHLMNKLRNIREESKEVFFVFQLNSPEIIPQLPPIKDPDSLLKCDFMDDRETFLIMCQEKNYEFSTVRRAKFTTLVLLYELHSHDYEKSATYTCNGCTKYIIGGYHCVVCDDYDLCARCWRELKHEHEMEYLITDHSGSNSDSKQSTKIEPRSHENDTGKLTHARLCKDTKCDYSGCTRIKRLISHFTTCSVKAKNTCALCKDLLTMCWHHAKYCKTKNCVVPTCERIKQKLANAASN